MSQREGTYLKQLREHAWTLCFTVVDRQSLARRLNIVVSPDYVNKDIGRCFLWISQPALTNERCGTATGPLALQELP
jgi:hypothetical protein